jgi:hypothetical protein
MIITVPALLKRSVEIAGPEGSFGLKEPWIFTSGGAVPPDVAAEAERIFGFWPLEVYGSTETCGIAWRQSKDGPAWNPFENAELRQNGDGCLAVKSTFIRDEAEFVIGDLVEFLPDGRFLLKGRADSIVKIEEKRISLPEVENRITQSGLVSDVAVIALADKRQYLAAAIVFNGRGREQFAGREKSHINKFFREHLAQFFENTLIPKKWRYLDVLPHNPQGKLLKGELETLFRDSVPLPHGLSASVSERTEDGAVFAFSVPGSSPYFDGHFPECPILPAVAQFELVCACAASLRKGFSASGSRRIKFSNIITPGVPLRLALELKQDALSFVLGSPDGAVTYSSGTINAPVLDEGENGGAE